MSNITQSTSIMNNGVHYDSISEMYYTIGEDKLIKSLTIRINK